MMILYRYLIGSINTLGFCLISAVFPSTLFVVLLVRFLMPIPYLRRQLGRFANEFPRYWGSSTVYMANFFAGIKMEVRGVEQINRQTWCLILPNHQSFSDILILHGALDAHVPPIRFFMKNSLKYMPFIGQVCLALGYPFMRRFTKSQIAKNPKMKGKDFESTKKACERFKTIPIAIVSFVEGTRYTPAKAKRQKTPFRHLLKPKAGGIAFTLAAMSGCMQKVVHVNIVYSGKQPPTLWRYLCGFERRIIVDVQVESIPQTIVGDYENDREFRVQFQNWLNETWAEKDQQITSLKGLMNAKA